jgi:hypothetical protein
VVSGNVLWHWKVLIPGVHRVTRVVRITGVSRSAGIRRKRVSSDADAPAADQTVVIHEFAEVPTVPVKDLISLETANMPSVVRPQVVTVQIAKANSLLKNWSM